MSFFSLLRFAATGISTGLGRLLGPTTGALLADPATQYPRLFGGNAFFIKFPYFLPCALGAAVCFATFVVAYFSLTGLWAIDSKKMLV